MGTRCKLLALVLLTVILAVPACRQDFKQTLLAPEEIPVEMREYAAKRPNVNDLVWRAFYEQGGYEIAVASFVGGDTLYGSFPGWIWVLFEDGQAVDAFRFGGMGDYPYRRPEPYYWSPGEELSVDRQSGESVYIVAVPGYAWHTAAYRVIGTTTQERTYEGSVVNGYWILFDLDVDGIDRFETVVLLDEQGKVLHTYTRTD